MNTRNLYPREAALLRAGLEALRRQLAEDGDVAEDIEEILQGVRMNPTRRRGRVAAQRRLDELVEAIGMNQIRRHRKAQGWTVW